MTSTTAARPNWIAARRDATSSALDQCFAEGLTGHTVVARDGKTAVSFGSKVEPDSPELVAKIEQLL